MAQIFLHRPTGLSVEVHADVNGGYVSRVLQLRGCISQGETELDALQGVEDALSVMLEVIQEDEPERYADLVGSTTVSFKTIATPPLVSGTEPLDPS